MASQSHAPGLASYGRHIEQTLIPVRTVASVCASRLAVTGVSRIFNGYMVPLHAILMAAALGCVVNRGGPFGPTYFYAGVHRQKDDGTGVLDE